MVDIIQLKKADVGLRFEIHQNIHIAVGAGTAFEAGAKEGYGFDVTKVQGFPDGFD